MWLQGLLFENSWVQPERKIFKLELGYSLEDVLSNLNIVEVGMDLLNNKPKKQPIGPNYRMLCPFHREKTPSFYLKPKPNIARCYGCGYAGSPILFICSHLVNRFDIYRYLERKIDFNPEIESQKQKLKRIIEQEEKFFRD